MKQNESIDYLIRSTWLTIQKFYNERAALAQSTMVMGFALISIDPKTGTPSTEMGPKMGIEPTSVSRTLNNLEDKGLIKREANPHDGRGVLVKLTPEGLKMRNVSKAAVFEFYEIIEQELTLEETEQLKTSLIKIKEIISVKQNGIKI